MLTSGHDSCPLASTSVHPPVCQHPQSLVLLLLGAELLLASRADIATRPGQVFASLCPSLCSSLTSVRLQRASVSLLPSSPQVQQPPCSVCTMLAAASKNVKMDAQNVPSREREPVGGVGEGSVCQCFAWAALGFADHSHGSRALPTLPPQLYPLS